MNYATKKKILIWCIVLASIMLAIIFASFVLLLTNIELFYEIVLYVMQTMNYSNAHEMTQHNITLSFISCFVCIIFIIFFITYYAIKLRQSKEKFHSKKSIIIFRILAFIQVVLLLVNSILCIIIGFKKDDGLELKVKQKKNNNELRKNKKHNTFLISYKLNDKAKVLKKDLRVGKISREYYEREMKKIEHESKNI